MLLREHGSAGSMKRRWLVLLVTNFIKFHLFVMKGAGEREQAAQLSVQVALGAANWWAAPMGLRR